MRREEITAGPLRQAESPGICNFFFHRSSLLLGTKKNSVTLGILLFMALVEEEGLPLQGGVRLGFRHRQRFNDIPHTETEKADKEPLSLTDTQARRMGQLRYWLRASFRGPVPRRS